MKITALDVHAVHLPYAGGVYRLSGGRQYQGFDAAIVRMETDTGLIGWGETTPFGASYIEAHAGGVLAALEELAPAVLGMDPRHHDRLYDRMDMAMKGQHAAKTAIDVAGWDVSGKAMGMPVADMLGGRIDGRVPLISSIGGDTPEAMRASVADFRARGFFGHSIKIGATMAEGGPALDAERIMACLADKQDHEWMLVDANGGLTVEHALRMMALLPPGLDFVLEAPCATWAETLSLRARLNHPLLLDELVETEADLINAIRHDACDGAGLKISKQGGLTPTRRQRDICRAAGLVTSIQDTVGSDIAFAAVLHVAQSTPRSILRCALDTRAMVSLTTAGFDAPVENGGAMVPDAPGLGVTPDLDVLGDPVAQYRR
ncbi:MAG: mandelate racemase/muconate lactonizing enzyme family protein [Alphaproteobacteria bacterium]|nr:mandelate racemase/muconate lactonizing enzyme family protein [Alphaproteobacteria bacterium]